MSDLEPDTQPILDDVAASNDVAADAHWNDDGPGHGSNKCKNPQTMSKRWMVTAWLQHVGENWTPRDFNMESNHIEYMCWGLERAPVTGNEHFHVYLRFSVKKRMSTVVQIFGSNQIHCETCKGSEKDCRDYCRCLGKHVNKQNEHITGGERGDYKEEEGKGQGKRSDLQEVAERVAHGALPAAIAAEHPVTYVRYFRGLEALYKAVQPQPPLVRDPPTIVYFWGPTRTGKTWRILNNPNLGSYFLVGTGPNAFDGYSGQESLIMDEWNYDQIPLNLMKKILDRYTIPIMCRYNNNLSAWKRVFISSQHGPMEQYPDAPQVDRDAFWARLTGRCWRVEQREDQGGPSYEQIMNSPPDF